MPADFGSTVPWVGINHKRTRICTGCSSSYLRDQIFLHRSLTGCMRAGHFRPNLISLPQLLLENHKRGDAFHQRLCVCVQSLSCVRLFDPMDCSTVRLPCPSLPLGVCSYSCPLSWGCYLTISFSAAPSDPPLVFNLSQHQGLFQWVRSSHQVAKVWELQLWHQSF